MISTLFASLLITGCGDNKSVDNLIEKQAELTATASKASSELDVEALTVTQLEGKLLNAKDLPNYLTRDIQDEVFYFVMPDRFNNGDTSNDLGSKTHPESAGGFDPTDEGKYHGGDIIGLKDKLPYLRDMGITAIWMTPIMRNQAVQGDDAGYHGYWILDFTEIDPHLGSNQDLKDLIAAAHDQNIKIFFDIITNHTADVIKYVECHGEDGLGWLDENATECAYRTIEETANGKGFTPIIPKGNENLKVPQWLNDPKYYHNQGDSFWQGESSVYGDFAGLDDIDTNNPFVVEGMTQIFKDVISEFKPDGFRIDTVKHVNIEFWQSFAPALVEHAKSIGIPKFFMFGEVYDADSKVLSEFTTTGKMQSILDFGFQSVAHKTIIEQKGTTEFAALFERDSDYLDEDSNADQLLTFVGNHDMGRFAHMVEKSEHNYSEQEQIQRTLLAHAMMYFSRGVPVVYYGDEQGFIGEGHDKGSRQNMNPSQVASFNASNLLATDKTTADDNFDTSHPFYRLFAEYAHVKIQNPALRYGATMTLYSQDTPGIYALSRKIDEQEVIVVINTANSDQSASFDLKADSVTAIYQGAGENHQVNLKDNKVSVTLPSLSFTVFEAK